jgi:serine/threonine-protein kinase PknG
VSSPTYKLEPVLPARQPCTFAGCGGTVDAGYCDTCGRAPQAPAGPGDGSRSPLPRLRPSSQRSAGSGSSGRPSRRGSRRTDSGRTDSGRTDSGRTGSGRSGSRRSGGTRLGLGLVDVPAVPTGDPTQALMPVAEVPEDKRYCSNCNEPVGRARNQRPGRTEGFCPHCRSQYSFTPKLQAGDLVGGQYEVLGVLAHGGLGWIYLARDRAVSDRWVVLKGLLDASSTEGAVAAVAERQFLAALDHSNVVRIYNFVTHEDAGYIVMEYVGGKSLKAILKERREANAGRMDPLPVDEAIAYTLATLPALGYFHSQGLVYCDMKPDNIVLTGGSLKIIDLGGVRRIDDDESAIYGTTGYQAPEVADDGPSVVSDLYTVGRMLAVLVLDFRGYQSRYVDSLPPPEEQPLLGEHESLHRFLIKATARDPEDRYHSAEEMSEQLLGILREEAAVRGTAQPAVSTVFGSDGVVAAGVHDEVQPDWRLLPQPKIDPNDPGVGFLLGLAEGEPAAVVDTLTSALADDTVPPSAEVLLHLARAQLGAGQAGKVVDATLDRLGDERDWRIWWHRGLRALAVDDAGAAVDWLDPVYTDLPGEVSAKLALALAHELAGDVGRSAALYDTASRTDPSYVSGAFGLARVRLAAGDREGAVEALARVPVASSAHVAAQIATVRTLTSMRPDVHAGAPSADQLERASLVLERLYIDPRRHGELAAELFEAALSAVAAGVADPARRLLGRPLVESSLRSGLESTYRQLARHALTPRERVDLVDRANRVRPRTLL